VKKSGAKKKHGKKTQPKAANPRLKELLARITPGSGHAEMDWGKTRGKEAW